VLALSQQRLSPPSLANSLLPRSLSSPLPLPSLHDPGATLLCRRRSSSSSRAAGRARHAMALRINADNVLVVPPFEAAWLTSDTLAAHGARCCLQFEVKGAPRLRSLERCLRVVVVGA